MQSNVMETWNHLDSTSIKKVCSLHLLFILELACHACSGGQLSNGKHAELGPCWPIIPVKVKSEYSFVYSRGSCHYYCDKISYNDGISLLRPILQYLTNCMMDVLFIYDILGDPWHSRSQVDECMLALARPLSSLAHHIRSYYTRTCMENFTRHDCIIYTLPDLPCIAIILDISAISCF